MVLRIAILFISLVMTFSVPLAADGDPQQVIRSFNEHLLDVMKHGKDLGFAGRQSKLEPVIASVYDMKSMINGVLGVAARKLSPDESRKIANAFTRFSVATYADQFSGWNGERFEVTSSRLGDNGLVVVQSRIIDDKNVPTEIDYLMRDESGSWRVVDVLFDGAISQVAVRRSEMLPIFRRDGVNGLIAVLDEKSQILARKR